MPLALLILGMAGVYAALRAFPLTPPGAPAGTPATTSGLLPPGSRWQVGQVLGPYTGALARRPMRPSPYYAPSTQPLPNGQSDNGAAASAALSALGATADVATVAMLVMGGPGMHHGSFPPPGGHGGFPPPSTHGGWDHGPWGRGPGVSRGYGGYGEVWGANIDDDDGPFMVPSVPSAPPTDIIEWALTSASSAQLEAVLRQYGGYPGVRAALLGRLQQLRAIGL